MNTLGTSAFLGRTSVDNIEQSYRQWLEAVALLNAQLKEDRSLLDRYIVCLLHLASRHQASSWAEEGEMVLSKARHVHSEFGTLKNAFPFLRKTSDIFLKEQEEQLRTMEEWKELYLLRERIIQLLGRGDILDHMQKLFFCTFLPVKPVDFYYRGFLEAFMLSLTSPQPCTENTMLSKIIENA